MSAFLAHYLLGDKLLQNGLSVETRSIFLLGLQGPDIIKFGMLQRENPEKYEDFFEVVKEEVVSYDKNELANGGDFEKGIYCYLALEEQISGFTSYALSSLRELDDSVSEEEYRNKVESAYDIILLRYEKEQMPSDLKPDVFLPQSELSALTAAEYYADIFLDATGESVDIDDISELILSGVRLAGRLIDKTTFRQIFVRRKEKKHKMSNLQSSMYRGMTEDDKHDYSNFCKNIWVDNGTERTDSLFELFDKAYENASAALLK